MVVLCWGWRPNSKRVWPPKNRILVFTFQCPGEERKKDIVRFTSAETDFQLFLKLWLNPGLINSFETRYVSHLFFTTYSPTALLFLHCATDGYPRIFAHHLMPRRQDSNPHQISRVAPDWDLWRVLFRLSHSISHLNTADCTDLKFYICKRWANKTG